jgi:hypothetical protein
MSREIACLLCKKALGEVASGSRLRPGTAHLCEEDANALRQKVTAEEQRRAADAFAKNKARTSPSVDGMGDVMEAFGNIFGQNPKSKN